jgi:hypothetical protein
VRFGSQVRYANQHFAKSEYFWLAAADAKTGRLAAIVRQPAGLVLFG